MCSRASETVVPVPALPPLILAGLMWLAPSLLAEPASNPNQAQAARFTDVTERWGVTFRHDHGGTGEKYMPENMAPGLAVLDVDGDDRLDLFFVQGAPVDGRKPAPDVAGHRLFRQRSDGTFVDVSRQAGVDLVGVGMGTCHGDVDQDGDVDLFVTQFGPDLLFVNAGDGTFEEQAQSRGLGGKHWSTGCTFFDPDRDGDLDLFVAAYVDFELENHKYCGNAKKKLRSYCHPDVYGAVPDRFFLNDGQGRFTEVGSKVGIVPSPEAKGLGVLAHDVDGDGFLDVFVANDSTMNQLYLGDGRGKFEETALLFGVGYNRSGQAEAGMGVDLGDVDGDGAAELFLTHLDRETNTLYRSPAPQLYVDATEASGLGPPSLPHVGFGTVFLDFDLDGDLDLAVVNGHILDNIHLFADDRSYRQPAQLFENQAGRFRELPGALPGTEALVGRGLVVADLDRDGDPDLVLTQNHGPARVLRNERISGSEASDARWLRVLLRGEGPTQTTAGDKKATEQQSSRGINREGYGVRLKAELPAKEAGKEAQVLTRFLPGARGYLSQGPAEVLLGFGPAPKTNGPRAGGSQSPDAGTLGIKIEVLWPNGRNEVFGPFRPGRTVTLHEGDGASP